MKTSLFMGLEIGGEIRAKNREVKMKTGKLDKKAVIVVVIFLTLAGEVRQIKAQPVFENIPVIIEPGHQSEPAVWGNYIVWKGAVGAAYDIEQRRIVEMPGLDIDGAPAIWDNKIVWSGANGYYDIDLQQMMHPAGLSVGAWPAMHNNKIVWSDSTGYYDVSLGQMVYPPDLSIGSTPDIFGDIIVWSQSTGYYDISLQQMIYPDRLHIGGKPAIYDTKIVWTYMMGFYYDIDLQEYVRAEGQTGPLIAPDIFEDRIVWHTYSVLPPQIIDIFVWDPIHKQLQITESGCAYHANIYNDIVVWTDVRSGDSDIYMAVIPEPATSGLMGMGLLGLLYMRKKRRHKLQRIRRFVS